MSRSRLLNLAPGVAVVLVALSWVFRRPALVEVGSGTPPLDVALHRPLSYLLLSPITATLDGLSLLTLSQHVAVLLTLIAGFAGRRALRRKGPRSRAQAWLSEARATLLFLVGLVGAYAAMTYAPRPLAQLRTLDPGLLVVDFHSHTRFSHDVSDRFDADWNRQLHARTGFHAAFLTDHGGWGGLSEAFRSNPDTAGGGLVLLTGSELWLGHENTLALGDTSTYSGHLDDRRIRILPDAPPQRRPTLLLTLPARRPQEAAGLDSELSWGLVGMEISDASPKGLEQGRRDRAELLGVARREDLALVSGSNNHGPGQTAAAWTLMDMPGWQTLTPAELEALIIETLHRDRHRATRVVERTLPYPRNPLRLVLALPALLWHLLTTLTPSERGVWAGYAFAVGVAGRLFRRDPGGPQPGDAG